MSDVKDKIIAGKTVIGIELGSTRIKAVLIDESGEPLATGGYEWENQFVDNIWTYDLDDVWTGLQASYVDLAKDVKEKYDAELSNVGAIGISAMMHGYLAFDEAGELLVPFRTWRNTITGSASRELMGLFDYNIPQRWSIAHLYQAILNDEEHVKDVRFFTTLSGYVHWKLTGQKVLGIGDASGMFPIDIEAADFNKRMIGQFNELVADKNYPWKLEELFPKVLTAGSDAGKLTEEGAKLLDPTGTLKAGIPLCPPEGDAGTGMVATNSVGQRTGNVSVGTSIFSMVVLEKELSKVYPELDMVTTPDGSLVAMVHCNNGAADLGSWVNLFKEFADSAGVNLDMGAIYSTLYNKALEGDADCGGLLAYNYLAGEHITGFDAGRPMFVRRPDAHFNLANFMRVNLFTTFGALKTGMDLLLKGEKARLDKIYGHGGLFKTKGVGQSILAAAIDTPVSVMETAGEGGAWGIALLAAYLVNKEDKETLPSYLDNKIFADKAGTEMKPDSKDVEGFEKFFENYKAGFPVEKAAIESL